MEEDSIISNGENQTLLLDGPYYNIVEGTFNIFFGCEVLSYITDSP